MYGISDGDQHPAISHSMFRLEANDVEMRRREREDWPESESEPGPARAGLQCVASPCTARIEQMVIANVINIIPFNFK